MFIFKECLVAFNFANEAEAAYMEKVLHEKLKVKEEKRLGKFCHLFTSNLIFTEILYKRKVL